MEDLTRRFEGGARDAWQMPDRVVETLLPFEVALDLGAGTGYFTRHLARHGRVIAVEPEAAFFPEARRSLDEVGETVDLVLCVNVWRFVDPQAIRRVLAPGGRLAVVDWHPTDTPVGPPLSERCAPPEPPGFRRLRTHAFLPHQWFVELALD